MPSRDAYHDTVRHALVKDGWRITHDPYTLTFGQKSVFVDLGAERIFAAEKDHQKIAVEIKTFAGASDIRDLENAVGQYAFYRSLLARFEPDRRLFLAVPIAAFTSTFEEPIVRPVIEDLQIAVFAFDPQEEVIIQWKP